MKKFKIFTDESCLKDQFLGYGGMFINEYHFNILEAKLEKYAEENGYKGIEFSYKKSGNSNIDRYIGFTNVFFDYINEFRPRRNQIAVDFRSLLLNTHTNPLQLTEKSEEEGFYKFYYQFITKSIFNITRQKEDIEFELHVADKPDSYQYRTEILNCTIGGCLKQEFGKYCHLKEIERGKPKEYRVHQLADVLLGCVTYRFNKKSNNKEPLVAYVESRNGKLFDDYKPWERKFNVWAFSSTGQKRWAPRAKGHA